jgi:hypothetical protein
MPRLVARYFHSGPASAIWQDFAAVLITSAGRHCPDWTIDVARIYTTTALNSPLGSTGNVYNTHKLEAWAAAVQGAADGAELLLTDVDLLIRRPLDDLWREPFDLAYTTKARGSRFPFNGGVVAVRVSARTRAFVERWRSVNLQMLNDPSLLQVWRPGFGGINQAALGMLITSGAHAGLAVRRLPCVEWNCEDESWASFDPAVTRIVHYKGDLQQALRRGIRLSPPAGELLEEWKAVWRSFDEEENRWKAAQAAAVPRAPNNMQITPGELEHRDDEIDDEPPPEAPAPQGDPLEDAPAREEPAPAEDPPPPPARRRRPPRRRPEVQP